MPALPLRCLAGLAAAVLACQALAAEPSGRPLPRFVSLRADEANLRTGPGLRYPVEWVYKRRELPLEVIAEYREWRKVRDWEGAEGWIHQTMLSRRRTVIVTENEAALRAGAQPASRVAALVEAGVVGELLGCVPQHDACRVRLGRTDGWIGRTALWGVRPGETAD